MCTLQCYRCLALLFAECGRRDSATTGRGGTVLAVVSSSFALSSWVTELSKKKYAHFTVEKKSPRERSEMTREQRSTPMTHEQRPFGPGVKFCEFVSSACGVQARRAGAEYQQPKTRLEM